MSIEESKIYQTVRNQTLYINNLNEKIKIDELKSSLNSIFSQFGEIMEIRARNTMRLKGQAFITFQNDSQAKEAMKQLNNQIFLGKPMKINFAKKPSERIEVEKGILSKEEKEKRDLNRKRKRDDFYQQLKKQKLEQQKQISYPTENDNVEKESNQNKNKIELNEKAHNILFVEGITKDINEETLKELFKTSSNDFKELRLFLSRGIAFVEYENVFEASKALVSLNNTVIGKDCTLKISFAKK